MAVLDTEILVNYYFEEILKFPMALIMKKRLLTLLKHSRKKKVLDIIGIT